MRGRGKGGVVRGTGGGGGGARDRYANKCAGKRV